MTSSTVTQTLQSGRHAVAPRVVLEFMKPVTWFPPMWAFACGVVSTGQATGPRAVMIATGVVLMRL